MREGRVDRVSYERGSNQTDDYRAVRDYGISSTTRVTSKPLLLLCRRNVLLDRKFSGNECETQNVSPWQELERSSFIDYQHQAKTPFQSQEHVTITP